MEITPDVGSECLTQVVRLLERLAVAGERQVELAEAHAALEVEMQVQMELAVQAQQQTAQAQKQVLEEQEAHRLNCPQCRAHYYPVQGKGQ